MTLKLEVFKCAKGAVYPKYMTKNSAALDLVAVSEYSLNQTPKLVRTGLKMAIPHGYVGKIYIRSSLGAKGICMANGVGIIDSDYRGEIKLPLQVSCPQGGFGSFMEYNYKLKKGERVAQIILEPIPKVEVVRILDEDALGETARGEGGLGSTNPGGINAID